MAQRDGDQENAEIGRVLEDARKAVKNGKPVLINAMMGRTDFRKGSISL
ncbi:MAG: hypothetical protein R2860_10145 [Desulfobacterales bacterium]